LQEGSHTGTCECPSKLDVEDIGGYWEREEERYDKGTQGLPRNVIGREKREKSGERKGKMGGRSNK